MPDAATTDRHRSPAVDYHTLADFRYRLRRFLRARELAARTAGVAPQQYLVLLQIKGSYGRELPTIGVLAERLQTQHHGVVQLVDRLVERGMVVLPAVGCARRPATTQAPAPSGVVMSPRAPAESASRRAVASSAAPVATIARPAPQEFVAVPELQDIHFDFDRYDIRRDDAKTL